MKSHTLKIFISLLFLFLINFEDIAVGIIPPITTLLVQTIFIIIFIYYFLQKSNEKIVIKNVKIRENKILSILGIIIVLNMNNIIDWKIPSFFIFLLGIAISVIVTIYVIPIIRASKVE